jgi:integrase
MPGRDTKTRFQGVFARHQERCKTSATGDPEVCNCSPSYYGSVWDRVIGKYRKTERTPRLLEARNARADLSAALRQGKTVGGSGLRFDDAREQFIAAARDGVVLNKWGRRYRRRAVENLESSLYRIPDWLVRRRLHDIRRGDMQRAADELVAEELSGSRVRSVVNAVRSLYRWAQDRELVDHDPAALVRLPATDEKPRDRVATPGEFARLLTALSRQTPKEKAEDVARDPERALADSVPWALAGYATARSQEIRYLDWEQVDWSLNAVELAADEEGRKPGGSWRVVPMVKPLRVILRRAWLAQGRPVKGKVCPPRKRSKSGMVSLDNIQEQVHKRWRALKLEPIGLHESRHTAATWLDHAGVSPKVASQLMGHKTPAYQEGAAPITLRRYTHTLPGELERARDLLDEFLAERAREEATSVRRP